MQKLMSNNKFNLKRFSQNEEWYNVDIANNPNTSPDILREILERGKDNVVSWCAARNPNCPPETLTMVLGRGNDDYVSQYAALNPNCPSETLTMVLERGKDNVVSWYAARNPNCPPETLTMVLARGNNDGVSIRAVRNPNCPPQAIVKWYRKTGKIPKRDLNAPNVFVQYDEPEEKVDEDLQKLEEMISEGSK